MNKNEHDQDEPTPMQIITAIADLACVNPAWVHLHYFWNEDDCDEGVALVDASVALDTFVRKPTRHDNHPRCHVRVPHCAPKDVVASVHREILRHAEHHNDNGCKWDWLP